MLMALLADVHANREAFEACLVDARRSGAERFILLGDLVGYGPDPVWAVETAARLLDDGALAVQGNHDAAASGAATSLNPVARAAIRWTAEQLGPAHKQFLADLPLDLNEDDRLYVHASASSPEDWIYVLSPREAFASFRATAQRITFCGHTHLPALFNESASSLPQQHTPADGRPVPLLVQRRWLAVLGAVGQPRDHNPAACYALFDDETRRLTYIRVPYDADVTARKVRAAGLPDALAVRLVSGS
ncbi:MAG TPA: metallophosphoesterase family protein [Hyphomicrobiaceae bacterium]|nr:metallophosphoesterase family protein [Hyphomicrobiaceae bacterium]